MDFIITHPDGTTLKLNSYEQTSIVESAKQSNAILGVDTVTINVKSATPLELYIGDTINVFGTTYTVNELPTAKRASGLYEYTIKCEGLQYGFIDRVFLMPDNTQGNNLMLDLKGIADILIENVNRNNTGKQFVLGNYPTPTEAKNLSYNDKNCLQVLQNICKEWDTEFQFVEDEDEITLHLQTIGDVYPYSFKYGQTGGLYNIQRAKGKSDVITRLFVYGGTQNLTYYRHNRLCLPNKDKNASYIEDAAAQAVYGIKEGVKNFDDIYPNRIGSVTALGADYKQFVDSSMDFDLNEKWGANDYAEWLALRNLPDTTANRNIFDNDVAGKATKWLIAGQTATIHFNSGSLAGYEIEIVSYDADTKTFKLKPLVDENNYEFPSRESAAFQIGVGDEYVILNINLPLSYKTAAEIKLATEAADYFDTVKAPLAQYTLEIDEFALKRIAGDNAGDTQIFKIGDYIHVVDADAGVDDDIRIQSLDRDLCNVYHYKLTLSNDAVKVNAQTRVLIDVDNIKRVIFENHLSDPNRQRRAYRDATELYDMVFDTDGYFQDKIAPLSIDTTMLKVGARSQQFTLQGITFQANYNADPTRLESSAGQLVHYTINDDDTIRTWNIAAGSFSNLATGGLYIYARCNRNDANGIIVITATQYRFDADSSYYYFLCGNLLSVDNVTNTRPIAMTYGFTTVNGRYIKTGRIQSSDGDTYFDLDTGVIAGNITFTAPEGSDNAATINGLINSNTNVENALKSANDGGLWPNRLFQLSTPTIGAASSETAPFGTARLLNSRDHQASESSAIPLIAGHTYHFVIEFYARRLSGSASLNCGVWTNNEGTMWHYGASTKVSDYDANWAFYRRSFAFTTPSGATTARLFFQIDQAYSGGDTQWLICDVQWYDADNDLAQTTASTALSNASAASTAAQNAQNAANTAQGTIDTMNGDTVFSVIEKKSFRSEWVAINGVVNTASGSATATGSYSKAVAATSGTTVGHSDLDTAYDNLRTYLNDKQLNINSNTSNFSQSTLGDYCKAYYNAETKLYNDLSDYYAEQAKLVVANLSGVNLCVGSVGNDRNPFVVNGTGTIAIPTQTHDGYESVRFTSTSNSTTFFQSPDKVAVSKTANGQKITISAWVLANFNSADKCRFILRGYKSGGANNVWSIGGYITPTYSDWKRVSISGTIPSDAGEYDGVMLFFTLESNSLWLNVTQIMVEQGEIATQWSFAPEDVTAAMKAEADAVREAQRYINEAMEQGTTTIGGGLVLSSMIQVCADAEHEQPRAGMNGVDPASSSGNPVRFWAGGALDDAQYVMNNAKSDNLNIRRAVKGKPTKFVVGQDGTAYFGNVVIDSPDDSSVRIENGTIKFINVESNEFVEKTVFTGESKSSIADMLSQTSASGTISASSATNVISGDKTTPQYSLYPSAVINISHDGMFNSATVSAPFTGKAALSASVSLSLTFGLNNISLVTPTSGLSFTFVRKVTATAYLAGTQIATSNATSTSYGDVSLSLTLPATAVSVSSGQLVNLQIVCVCQETLTFSGTAGVTSAIKLSSLAAQVPAITAKTLTFTRNVYNNKIFANGLLMSNASNNYFGVCPIDSNYMFKLETASQYNQYKFGFRKDYGLVSQMVGYNATRVNPLIYVMRIGMNTTSNVNEVTTLYNPQGFSFTANAPQGTTRQVRITHNMGRIPRIIVQSVSNGEGVMYRHFILNEDTTYIDIQFENGSKPRADVYFYDTDFNLTL